MSSFYQINFQNRTVDLTAITTFRGFEDQSLTQLIPQVAFCRQTHSDAVVHLEAMPKTRPAADAMITRTQQLGLGVYTADCVPVFVFDSQTPAIGIAHAGWRGTLSRIAAKTVMAMTETFGTQPKNCQIYLGASIQRCCYVVKPALADQFALAFGDEVKTKAHFLDLYYANRAQLVLQGVPSNAIVASPYCTSCRTDLFYSYRAESNGLANQTGRMISAIGLTARARLP